MQDWLAARVKASPEALALIVGERHWTYRALDGMVAKTAVFLSRSGVSPGDYVAVLMDNCVEYVCLIHALARLGAVLVPLNTRLTTSELEWQVSYVGADWLVTGEEKELSIANCQLLIVNETALMEANGSLTIGHWPLTIDNLQVVVFTSGTSGRPKGVPLTFANHFYSAMASAYRLGLDVDDLWLSCLPLYHVGGLAVVFRSCLYGTAVDLHPRFDLDAISHALDTKPVTLISLVPTMLYRLLQTRDHWPASLRLILLGGAAASPELMQQANELPRSVSRKPYSVSRKPYSVSRKPYSVSRESLLPHGSRNTEYGKRNTDHGPPIIAPTYGLTEASSQVATMLPRDAAKKPGSVGKPLLFTTVRILDENGAEQPTGHYGEVVVTGPTVMAGYFGGDQRLEIGDSVASVQSPFSNPQSLPPFNTIRTGDVGYLDGDGDLWLVQRRSDVIVSGGENVYPAEVEQVLKEHPTITAVCVVGVPDPEWGQRVAAMVVANDDLTAAELETFARRKLAGYKIPRLIRFVDKLPQTASGKVARQAVADLMREP